MKKHIFFSLLTALMISCSAPDKKAQLEKLKKQHEEITAQIETLEKELAKNDSTPKKINLVEVVPVAPEVFQTYIAVQGKIDADENVALSSQIPGTITKINVKPGDQVSAGQVLAETDSRAIQQNISTMQTNLDLVSQMYEKQKSLWDQKIGTEVQFLQTKTQKESLEKQIAAMQEQLRMSKIISPIDGTVDAVDIKLGQAVMPGLQSIRVVNFSNLKVKADLAEAYASRVKKGDNVKIYFPDMNDSIISKINYSARAINTVNRTFAVEALLDDKKDYHPNMVTRLMINDYTSPAPVIVIPVKVIQTGLENEKYVYIADGDKVAKRVIKTGHEYEGRIEVTEGLKASDPLIVEGFQTINEGDNISYK